MVYTALDMRIYRLDYGLEMSLMKHRIAVSDDVYDYLKGMIEDEFISNGDMSEERNQEGETVAHKPTFSEVISHLIEDREEALEVKG